MSDIFRRIKDAKEKEAADLFLQQILPLSGDLIFTLEAVPDSYVIGFPQCSTTGLLKPFPNQQPGLQVGCRTAVLLP
jgi:hypothetical protein